MQLWETFKKKPAVAAVLALLALLFFAGDLWALWSNEPLLRSIPWPQAWTPVSEELARLIGVVGVILALVLFAILIKRSSPVAAAPGYDQRPEGIDPQRRERLPMLTFLGPYLVLGLTIGLAAFAITVGVGVYIYVTKPAVDQGLGNPEKARIALPILEPALTSLQGARNSREKQYQDLVEWSKKPHESKVAAGSELNGIGSAVSRTKKGVRETGINLFGSSLNWPGGPPKEAEGTLEEERGVRPSSAENFEVYDYKRKATRSMVLEYKSDIEIIDALIDRTRSAIGNARGTLLRAAPEAIREFDRGR